MSELPKQCQECPAAKDVGDCPVGRRVYVRSYVSGEFFGTTIRVESCSPREDNRVVLRGVKEESWQHEASPPGDVSRFGWNLIETK